MIGFTGPHRVGKSTLARRVADNLNWGFVATDSKGVFEQIGVSPKEELPFDIRLDVQIAILESLARQYDQAGREFKTMPWITDRTPLDVLMYSWADVGRTSIGSNSELGMKFDQHVVRAMELTSRYFSQIWWVQPGIEIAETEGKAPSCRYLLEHLNMLIPDIANHQLQIVPVLKIPREIVSLEDREALVTNSVAASLTHPPVSQTQ